MQVFRPLCDLLESSHLRQKEAKTTNSFQIVEDDLKMSYDLGEVSVRGASIEGQGLQGFLSYEEIEKDNNTFLYILVSILAILHGHLEKYYCNYYYSKSLQKQT